MKLGKLKNIGGPIMVVNTKREVEIAQSGEERWAELQYLQLKNTAKKNGRKFETNKQDFIHEKMQNKQEMRQAT